MADVPLVNQADIVDGDNDISPQMRRIEASFKASLKAYKRKFTSFFFILVTLNVVVLSVVVHHYWRLNDKMANLSVNHQLLDNRLTALSSKLSDLSVSHQSLGDKVTMLSSKLSDLSTSHRSLSDEVITLSNKLADLSASHESLDHKLAALSDRLSESLIELNSELSTHSSSSIFSYISSLLLQIITKFVKTLKK